MKNKHIENLDSSMRPEKSISPKMRALLDAEKVNARKRISQRGIVHFRADEEFMEALFTVADKLKIAPGTLCRQVVWEYLQATSSTSAATVKNKTEHYINKRLVIKLELLERTIKELLSSITGTASPRKSKR